MPFQHYWLLTSKFGFGTYVKITLRQKNNIFDLDFRVKFFVFLMLQAVVLCWNWWCKYTTTWPQYMCQNMLWVFNYNHATTKVCLTILFKIITGIKLVFSKYLGRYSYSFRARQEWISVTVTVLWVWREYFFIVTVRYSYIHKKRSVELLSEITVTVTKKSFRIKNVMISTKEWRIYIRVN